MDDLIKAAHGLKQRVQSIEGALSREQKENRLAELTRHMSETGFWQDRAQAQELSREASELEKWLQGWKELERRLDDLIEVASADNDDHAVTLRAEVEKELRLIEEALALRETETLLSERYDASPAILTLYSGAGGVDAQDWASMLERMFIRFASRMGWTATILSRTVGQGAGIKNVTVRIAGPFAYGYLRVEAGVHRLVRLSPFDADKARHTSFAMVEVLPELEEAQTIEVDTDDVRVDVFRSSGHGGQSVNTTDSAVRLTHLPTGISVSCQNERSQLQNKAQAWKMLLGKLERYYQAQREEERLLLRGELSENAWGSQIRSYVLHPYKLVKDHRTKYESKDPDSVLDGDLMPFIEAGLKYRLREADTASVGRA